MVLVQVCLVASVVLCATVHPCVHVAHIEVFVVAMGMGVGWGKRQVFQRLTRLRPNHFCVEPILIKPRVDMQCIHCVWQVLGCHSEHFRCIYNLCGCPIHGIIIARSHFPSVDLHCRLCNSIR